MWMAHQLCSINLEPPAVRYPTPNRPSTRVGDHDKLNLDCLFANSRNVGHYRCESVQHEAGNQLIRKAIGKHQALGDAARNVGKPLQGTAFVVRHGLPSLAILLREILRASTTLLQFLSHLNFFCGNNSSWAQELLKQLPSRPEKI
jgi:hypothetical protein